ncbi:MAG: hypothetical protein F6K25_10290 [Okeania sp. SIO2G4]|uniref:hypothetical protein n=1 Tax=unclassified Okeania TaxID=2634635 RepID=UPI0013B95EAF|nr:MULTISPECIES: hypothetical protein [unclassified Okeania]NEP03792.1 hypothetical protein [Okeania sp. SIO4D6]NEP41738.1 hypothetical protein [Okeania sp. SIO2H7]NEP72096.1 hypothetical protein [Okeania sp. SIO2G5]NEP92954.1 hypothetical protein [Okeania sp. SIO2F5]NEQ91074.1 hypothetical protein [Okeania sp. SIO2G4]
MEPITIVMALAAVLGTKALEKTGENIGQVVWDKSAKLMKYLKQESPDTVTAIEQVSEQPLDYGQAVLSMQEAAENPDVARTIQELAVAMEENTHPKLTEVVAEIREALKSHESQDNKNAKIVAKEVKAETGGMVVGMGDDGIVGGTVKIKKIDKRTTI